MIYDFKLIQCQKPTKSKWNGVYERLHCICNRCNALHSTQMYGSIVFVFWIKPKIKKTNIQRNILIINKSNRNTLHTGESLNNLENQ